MNGLSLFTGSGIGELAFKQIIPDYKTVGYVEIDPYCRAIIRARIRDGILDDAPIFDDIRVFNERYASLFAGKVDWISGGFPCQPFSVAGRRAGEADERNMWPATRDAISIIRPQYAFLENVPGLLTSGYFGTVVGDLAEIGYDCEWDTLGAGHIGAPYPKRRVWLLASMPNSVRLEWQWETKAGTWSKQQFEGLLLHQLQLAVHTGNIGRVAVRDAHRFHRLRAIGNGWVVQCLARILQVDVEKG